MCCCLRDPTFSRFSTTPTCDGQTDRRTQGHGQYCGCIASRGKKWKTEKLGSGTEPHRRAAGVGGMLNSVDTTVARNAHVRRQQTASWRPEVPLRACLAATSGCIVRTVDTLATAAQLVPCGFRVQRSVVDTVGGVAVALAPSTGIAVC